MLYNMYIVFLLFIHVTVAIISCPAGTYVSNLGNCVTFPDQTIQLLQCPTTTFCPHGSAFPYTCSSDWICNGIDAKIIQYKLIDTKMLLCNNNNIL